MNLKEKDALLEEKNALMKERLSEKDTFFKERLNEKDALIKMQDKSIEWVKSILEKRVEENDTFVQGIQDAHKLEKEMLSMKLERTNTEMLKLTGNLSVRGMIEKIELQYSDRRRKEGSNVSRVVRYTFYTILYYVTNHSKQAVWTEILGADGLIKAAVIKTCSGRNAACKMDSAIEAIVQIYRKVSDEVHNAGCDEIPIRRSMFHCVQLEVLRGLCAATHYATREMD